MLLYVFIFLYSLYAIYIIRWLKRSLNGDLSFFYSVNPENTPEKEKPFARFDRNKWPQLELYFCIVFLFPIRLLITIISTVSYYSLIMICDLIWSVNKEQPPIKRTIIRLGGNLLSRTILFCAGFYWIKSKKVLISDYLPEYKGKENDMIKAPLIVSNHFSWLDIFYFISSKFCPSFLSKKEVSNYPLVGRIAVGLKSLFVTRDNRSDKNQILELIQERTSRIKAGKNDPQILIFPEGTTTNGKFLISFKKGAFMTMDPIKIICLKYEERNFSLCYDGIGDLYCFIFPFCLIMNQLTVYEFDVFDPKYLNLSQGKDDDWVIYMKKVKEVMLKCLDVENSEAGFNEKKEYYKNIREQIKNKDKKN